jgi:hypothetical protein
MAEPMIPLRLRLPIKVIHLLAWSRYILAWVRYRGWRNAYWREDWYMAICTHPVEARSVSTTETGLEFEDCVQCGRAMAIRRGPTGWYFTTTTAGTSVTTNWEGTI